MFSSLNFHYFLVHMYVICMYLYVCVCIHIHVHMYALQYNYVASFAKLKLCILIHNYLMLSTRYVTFIF